MPHLPKLHWYDNPVLLWVIELIALGALIGAFGRNWPVAVDVILAVVITAALAALNYTIARRRAHRT
ncbi:MAG: hypothetical protein ACXVQJ_08685 [Actinomycetota bacterium]